MFGIPDDWLWIVFIGFFISFLLAAGIGANDVANSFGTSVGSKVLTLVKACILGTIFEILGAILIGYKVSDTIRKGIIDVNPYNGSEKLLLLGNLSALSGSFIWMFIATFLRLPVSATHSIVGATVGFSLVAQGPRGVGWYKLIQIFVSWFISPLISGVISSALFFLIRKLVLSKEKPLEPGLRVLPFFYGATILINAISIFLDGSELLHFDKIPLYGAFIISIGLALLVTGIVRFLVVPRLRKKIIDKLYDIQENGGSELRPIDSKAAADCNGDGGDMQLNNGTAQDLSNEKSKESEDPASEGLINGAKKNGCAKQKDQDSSDSSNSDVEVKQGEGRASIEDNPVTSILFSFLQILTAIFGSFAHGGNDVSNAIGPLVALWVVSTEQSVAQKAETPIWILLYGGVGISLGLWVWGRRVIQTMGEDLSKITPSSGFCIELGAALTVLIASNLGVPISTTHCKVGSIVFVGRMRSNENVDWSLFRNIIFAWVMTLPAAGGLSALIMFVLKSFAL